MVNSMNAEGFSKALMDLSDHIDGEVSKVIRKGCIDLYARIVARTPVDSGRAKMNWQLSTSGHSSERMEDPDGYSVSEIAGHINSETSEFRLDINDDTVTLYNNLEYISNLEAGDSQQAPQGMVAISLAEFEQHFREALAGAGL